MKFRWKLLILLTVMSILPVIAQRTYGIHNVLKMADSLLNQLEQSRKEEAVNRLGLLAGQFSRSIARSREQVEMALFFQALEARQILENAPGVTPKSHNPDDRLVFDFVSPSFLEDNEDANTRDHQILMAYGHPGNAEPKINPVDLIRFANSFFSITRHMGALSIRHITLLGHDVIAWPGEPYSSDATNPGQQIWFHTAVSDQHSLWSAPYFDSALKKPVMAVSMPLMRDNMETGLTGIIVSLHSLVEPESILSELPDGSRLMIVTTPPQPEKTGATIHIVLAFRRESSGDISGIVPESVIYPDTATMSFMSNVLQDIIHRKSGIREMTHSATPEFWAFGLLPHQGTGFVLTSPFDQKLQNSLDTLRFDIVQRVGNIEKMTAISLLILIGAVLISGLWFSGRVTRAIDTLSHVAGRLAAGDFDARAAIDSNDEFGDIGKAFNRVGPQLKVHYRMLQSAEVAMEIQQKLLPAAPPVLPGFDIDAMTIYCEDTGGDYFDYLCTGKDEKMCLAVGDVTGHGMPSALLMASVRGMLRLRATIAGPIDAILNDVNRCFSLDMAEDAQFMTLFLARIDLHNQILEWVRAGHEPAILYDIRKDMFTDLVGEGIALGVDDGATYVSSRRILSCDLVLCIFSDGIIETRNSAGDLFGRDRLRNIIRQNTAHPAKAIVLSILDAVSEFRGDEEQEDDLTVMVVKTHNCDASGTC